MAVAAADAGVRTTHPRMCGADTLRQHMPFGCAGNPANFRSRNVTRWSRAA